MNASLLNKSKKKNLFFFNKNPFNHKSKWETVSIFFLTLLQKEIK